MYICLRKDIENKLIKMIENDGYDYRIKEGH